MKKNLLYPLTLLCALSFFTACDGKDDPPVVDESWKELSGTYHADELSLTLNGTELADVDGRRSIALNATSAETVTIVLNNVIPDNNSFTINAGLVNEMPYGEMGKGVKFSLSGEQAVNGATITVEGKFINNGGGASLSGSWELAVTRKLATELTGNLNLNFKTLETPPLRIGDVYVNLQSGDAALDAQVNQGVPMLVGQQLAAKVSAVKVNLKEDGTFDVKWTNAGETTDTGMPDMVAAMGVKVYYFVAGNKLMLALDKGLLTNPALVSLLDPVLEQYGLSIELLVSLMEDLGGYYAIPVNYTIGEYITFYVDKVFIIKAAIAFNDLLTPMMGSLPEEYAPLIQGVMAALPTAEKAEVGLVFSK